MNTKTIFKHGPKLVRVVWNTNGWQSPSGSKGKSPHMGNHEHDYGYGYEEWLFDPKKQIDGYQYGFLQPFNQCFSKYTGDIFPDVYLYTIEAGTGRRYWVAHLRDVEVLTLDECKKITKQYDDLGLRQEMLKQIQAVAGQKDFSSHHNGRLAHLRFKHYSNPAGSGKPYLKPNLLPINPNHAVYRLNRFKLYDASEMELPS